jgi:NAD(P)-dependent dehydrogenase (short-subunit alcohol dehydrogenase family)
MQRAVALVTGASRGVGRGIALSLAEAGMTIYATGRTVLEADLPPAIMRVRCDHTADSQVAAVFEQIRQQHGRLDVLVNSCWDGYQHLFENGRFVWDEPFWRQPRWRWDSMMTAGVRAAFVASQHAALMMMPVKSGLIVNLSFWAAQKYLGGVLYGCAKAATDKLTVDMAHELRPHEICVMSLYPGLVRTETVLSMPVPADLSNSESPEFVGRAVAAVAGDPGRMRLSGSTCTSAQLGLDYGFADVDGRQPRPLTLAEV